MNYIQEFYFGNIRPAEDGIRQTAEYKRALHTVIESEKKLQQMLSGESEKELLRLLDAQSALLAEMTLAHFESGFRYGVQMMCDCLK